MNGLVFSLLLISIGPDLESRPLGLQMNPYMYKGMALLGPLLGCPSPCPSDISLSAFPPAECVEGL